MMSIIHVCAMRASCFFFYSFCYFILLKKCVWTGSYVCTVATLSTTNKLSFQLVIFSYYMSFWAFAGWINQSGLFHFHLKIWKFENFPKSLRAFLKSLGGFSLFSFRNPNPKSQNFFPFEILGFGSSVFLVDFQH